jgi:flagellar hook-basal body complex protein FliE
MTELKPLSKKHERVLSEYLLRFNQWQAYKAVYPKITDEAARTASSRLFATDNFRAHLEERLNEVHMSANEALRLTADIARGDIGDLMDITSMGGMINLKRAQELGLTKLIKKVKQKTVTKLGKKEDDEDVEIHDLELELYPADAALERILKITGKFREQVDITSGGEKLEKVDHEGFDRAIATLADTLREIVSGKDTKQES